ncbi:MAG: nicotinate (nicotinamide) nucleotide adenylyltransferase [Bdellovibrionales bacterium]|nr:nicotinate (nicotinamide) nucleotide adenylyltransferase [Bdellovibrionales bacterium]
MSKKVGIFGGTFNPVHRGHEASVRQVHQLLNLDKIIVVPTFQSPHRMQEEVAPAPQRLEMVKRAFASMDFVEVSSYECTKKSVSYTIETLEHLKSLQPNDELYLIIGADQFNQFHRWQDFAKILQISHLVVTSRPGVDLVQSKLELPEELARLITNDKNETWNLTTGKKIYLIQLEDVEASSSEIRSRLRSGESVSQLLNQDVEKYIKEQEVYPPIKSLLKDYLPFTHFCAQVLADGKAINIVAKDMRDDEKPMEFALIASGNSRKHATALAEQVARQVKKKYRFNPLHIDGQVEGQWIVLDYGSLMVHIFYDYTRQEYQLEKLWGEVKDLELDLK